MDNSIQQIRGYRGVHPRCQEHDGDAAGMIYHIHGVGQVQILVMDDDGLLKDVRITGEHLARFAKLYSIVGEDAINGKWRVYDGTV